MLCQRVIYAGDVQGVGFRYRVLRLSRGFSVVGYVKNLADGTVELVAQGEDEQVKNFIAAIQEEMGWHIRSAVQSPAPSVGTTEFKVER